MYAFVTPAACLRSPSANAGAASKSRQSSTPTTPRRQRAPVPAAPGRVADATELRRVSEVFDAPGDNGYDCGPDPYFVDMDLFEDGLGEGLEGGDYVPEIEVGNTAADELLKMAGYDIKPFLDADEGEDAEDGGDFVFEFDEDEFGEADELGWARGVPLDAQLFFARKGHCSLPDLILAEETVALAKDVDVFINANMLDGFKQKVEVLFDAETASRASSVADAERILDGATVPFLQFFNLHESVPSVDALARSPLLGRIAAELLGADSVRLYQDSVFFKRPGDGATPWHADSAMAPLDGDMVTIFVPLRALPGGKYAPSLRFASRSHLDVGGFYWNVLSRGGEEAGSADLEIRYKEESHGAMALGSATAHAGWTLHSSPGIPDESRGRRAISFSYVSSETKVLSKQQQARMHTEDGWSFRRWLRKSKPGKPLKHALLPVVWPAESDS